MLVTNCSLTTMAIASVLSLAVQPFRTCRVTAQVDDAKERRLKFMERRLDELQLALPGGGPFSRTEKPILRFSKASSPVNAYGHGHVRSRTHMSKRWRGSSSRRDENRMRMAVAKEVNTDINNRFSRS